MEQGMTSSRQLRTMLLIFAIAVLQELFICSVDTPAANALVPQPDPKVLANYPVHPEILRGIVELSHGIP